MASVEPETPKAWSSRRRGSRRRKRRGGEEWGRGIPLSSRIGGLWERRKLPQREKRFYCFLSVSERLSLQRLLKINVVTADR